MRKEKEEERKGGKGRKGGKERGINLTWENS